MKKTLIICALILTVCVCVGLIFNNQSSNAAKKALENSIVTKATELGLEDVSVDIYPFKYMSKTFHYVRVSCSNFSTFSIDEMRGIDSEIEYILPDLHLVECYYQGNDRYEVYHDSIYLNGNIVYEKPSVSTKTQGTKKCSLCNGTGSVKYYYGSSAVEAWLDGQEDYTFGPCSRCDGTGRE
jgi:hypothetical protein